MTIVCWVGRQRWYRNFEILALNLCSRMAGRVR